MTNHWNDIDNTSLVLVFGANPAENHPACMAHVNAARFGSKKARLIVVDPRLTRTARQIDPNRKNLAGVAEPDFYVRIRPGTNVAFTNGLMNWIFNNIASYDAEAATNMEAWHNGTNAAVHLSVARSFIDDAGTTQTLNAAALAGAKYDGVAAPQLAAGYPKYADTRFKVNAAGTDYERAILTCTANTGYLTDPAWRFPEFPVIAANVSDPDCVYQKLKAHVAPYTPAVVADICGCTEAELADVAKALIDNSRFKSSDFAAATATPQVSGYRASTILYAMGQTQHTNGSQNIKDLAVIQTIMGNMGRPGGGINALRGIHNVQGSTDFGLLFDSIPGYSGNPATGETYQHYSNTLFGNRVMPLANTETQYTSVAKDIHVQASLGLQQAGFQNMTQEWFGNGLVARADIEKLYDIWPKGNGVQHIQTFRYMADTTAAADLIKAAVVWGQNPAVTEPNQSAVRTGLKNLDLLVVVDMFETETAAVDRKDNAPTYLIPACSHAEEAGSVTNSGRWLQWRERAVKPMGNSKADLELLLRFAYALDKAGAFSHFTNVAYDGAATDVPTSGVWSTLATKIAGPAYKVLYGDKYGWTPTDATAFEALSTTTEMWPVGASAPVDKLVYGSEVVAEKIYIEICRPLADTATSGGTMWIYSGAGNAAGYYAGALLDVQPSANIGAATAVVNESVVLTGTAAANLANSVVVSTPAPVVKSADGLTTYAAKDYAFATAGAKSTIARTASSSIPDGATVLVSYSYNNNGKWLTKARAKSRNNTLTGAAGTANANNYPRWGWAWLLNRRVFYNNSEVGMDVADVFVSPGVVSLTFTESGAPDSGLTDWSALYRKYKTFNDVPSVVAAAGPTTTGPHFIAPGLSLAGRFPGHTEPIESPRADLVTKYGHNTSKGSNLYWTGANPTVPGAFADFPLVLTSIRCVEHFQGGPITRNNSWNVEAEPVPWVEINSLDASKYGIKDGDWVNVETARSNSGSDQEGRTREAAGWARGFKARVGVGLQSNQRVAQGVVAIPWHWGDKGLSKGSRANDLCIDAWDANTMIPEYKACLCKISKMPSAQ